MPAISSDTIRVKNPLSLFGDVNVSEKDLAHYKKLIEDGEEDQAIDEFIEKYIAPFIALYQTTLQNYLKQAESGQMTAADQGSMEKSVALLSVAVSGLISRNFKDFTSSSLAPVVFEQNEIATAKLKKVILDQTLAQFEQLTKSTMLETQSNVLNYIRTLQKEMVIKNQELASMDIIGAALEKEISGFKDSLRAKYPDIFKAMEEGKILKSSIGPDGNSKNFNLDAYTQMSVRTTLLNVDRTAVEVDAKMNDEDVVEYYLRDRRTVKKDRQICIHILSQKIAGKSLLALTQEAAAKYGILTLAEAKASGAMGPHCRHGIRRLAPGTLQKINDSKESVIQIKSSSGKVFLGDPKKPKNLLPESDLADETHARKISKRYYEVMAAGNENTLKDISRAQSSEWISDEYMKEKHGLRDHSYGLIKDKTYDEITKETLKNPDRIFTYYYWDDVRISFYKTEFNSFVVVDKSTNNTVSSFPIRQKDPEKYLETFLEIK